MKRDMDLVRQILLTIEDHQHGFAPIELTIDGYPAETIGYHIWLLGNAELLDVEESTSFGRRARAR